jgi:thiamine biosynthesis lipoprotein
MKRRQFILSLAGTAAAGLTGWQLARLMKTPGLEKVSQSGWRLGTNISMTVFHDRPGEAEKAIAEAFSELDRVEDVMSLYRPESQLSRLNRQGHLDNPHPWLGEVLIEARKLSIATEGVFDVTVQPLWTLHHSHSRTGTTATEEEIRSALANVNWRNVEVTGARITLQRGTEITLNGIAQGFAADVVARIFNARGIKHALIDTGEINTVGSHAEKDAWSIGIKHPRIQQEFLGLAALNGRCMATSGDYETRFSDDYSRHHLLDPRTGLSSNRFSSVSVVAKTALQADALSTAVFLLGPDEGRRLIESTDGADALFVCKAGQASRTSGFPLIS